MQNAQEDCWYCTLIFVFKMLTISKCSDGDPCSTCVSVESARLWKLPCMRTRVASEFDLYSTGMIVFHSLWGQILITSRFAYKACRA